MLIGYARVSTFEQNLDMQVKALEVAGCQKIFTDTGITGAIMDRPGLIAAREYCRPGDVLVCWKLDRLGRTVPGVVAFIESLKQQDIGFKSLTEGCGTGSPIEQLLLNLLAAVAQWELGTIKERSITGLIAARNAGRIGGRPKKLSKKDLKIIKAIRDSGELSAAAIAEKFGISRATLYRYLKDDYKL